MASTIDYPLANPYDTAGDDCENLLHLASPFMSSKKAYFYTQPTIQTPTHMREPTRIFHKQNIHKHTLPSTFELTVLIP